MINAIKRYIMPNTDDHSIDANEAFRLGVLFALELVELNFDISNSEKWAEMKKMNFSDENYGGFAPISGGRAVLIFKARSPLEKEMIKRTSKANNSTCP